MTLPGPEGSSAGEPEAVQHGRPGAVEDAAVLGTDGDQWRLLLGRHTGRAGHRAITQQLLAPLLSSGDPDREAAALIVLHAAAGPQADTRLQNITLEAQLAALPPGNDDDRLRIHHVLAANYDTLGEYRQALAHGQHELALRASIYSPGHPDTLATRRNIAQWTGRCGDAAAALELFQELLPDQERVLGPDHPHTLTVRANLARWIGEAGDAGCSGLTKQG